MADAIEDGEEVVNRGELEQALAELAALKDFGFERDCAGRRGKDEALADGDFAAGTNESAPAIFAGGFGEHDFNAAGRLFTIADERAMRIEARGNDAAVVEDEKVAGAEMFSKTRKRIVAESARCAVHDEHAAGAALGRRLLRDEIFGQIVVEVGYRTGAPRSSVFGGDGSDIDSLFPKWLSAWRRARSMAAVELFALFFESCLRRGLGERGSSETN